MSYAKFQNARMLQKKIEQKKTSFFDHSLVPLSQKIHKKMLDLDMSLVFVSSLAYLMSSGMAMGGVTVAAGVDAGASLKGHGAALKGMGGAGALKGAGDHLLLRGEVLKGTIERLREGEKFIIRSQESLGRVRYDLPKDGVLIGRGEMLEIQQKANATFIMESNSERIAKVLGSIQSPGNLIMAFPGGLYVGREGKIDVRSLTLAAGKIDEGAFARGQIKIQMNNTKASIQNFGSIRVSDGGLAAFVAPHVANYGMIVARGGRVELSTGDAASIDFYGDDLIKIKVTSTKGKATLKKAKALAKQIKAEDGIVIFSTEEALDIVRDVVNVGQPRDHVATIEAGEIVIGEHAIATHLGSNTKLTAKQLDGSGGRVQIQGTHIHLNTNASIDASSKIKEGGLILIGGDWHGGDVDAAYIKSLGWNEEQKNRIAPKGAFTIKTEDNAQRAKIKENTLLNTSGKTQGGKTVVWSDNKTTMKGKILSLSIEGMGGDFEVSGKGQLKRPATFKAINKGKSGQGIRLFDPHHLVFLSGTSGELTNAPWLTSATVLDITSIFGRPEFAGSTASFSGEAVSGIRISTIANGDIYTATGWSVIKDAITLSGSLTIKAAQGIQVRSNLTASGNLTLESSDGNIKIESNLRTTGAGLLKLNAVSGDILAKDNTVLVDAYSVLEMNANNIQREDLNTDGAPAPFRIKHGSSGYVKGEIAENAYFMSAAQLKFGGNSSDSLIVGGELQLEVTGSVSGVKNGLMIQGGGLQTPDLWIKTVGAISGTGVLDVDYLTVGSEGETGLSGVSIDVVMIKPSLIKLNNLSDTVSIVMNDHTARPEIHFSNVTRAISLKGAQDFYLKSDNPLLIQAVETQSNSGDVKIQAPYILFSDSTSKIKAHALLLRSPEMVLNPIDGSEGDGKFKTDEILEHSESLQSLTLESSSGDISVEGAVDLGNRNLILQSARNIQFQESIQTNQELTLIAAGGIQKTSASALLSAGKNVNLTAGTFIGESGNFTDSNQTSKGIEIVHGANNQVNAAVTGNGNIYLFSNQTLKAGDISTHNGSISLSTFEGGHDLVIVGPIKSNGTGNLDLYSDSSLRWQGAVDVGNNKVIISSRGFRVISGSYMAASMEIDWRGEEDLEIASGEGKFDLQALIGLVADQAINTGLLIKSNASILIEEVITGNAKLSLEAKNNIFVRANLTGAEISLKAGVNNADTDYGLIVAYENLVTASKITLDGRYIGDQMQPICGVRKHVHVDGHVIVTSINPIFISSPNDLSIVSDQKLLIGEVIAGASGSHNLILRAPQFEFPADMNVEIQGNEGLILFHPSLSATKLTIGANSGSLKVHATGATGDGKINVDDVMNHWNDNTNKSITFIAGEAITQSTDLDLSGRSVGFTAAQKQNATGAVTLVGSLKANDISVFGVGTVESLGVSIHLTDDIIIGLGGIESPIGNILLQTTENITNPHNAEIIPASNGGIKIKARNAEVLVSRGNVVADVASNFTLHQTGLVTLGSNSGIDGTHNIQAGGTLTVQSTEGMQFDTDLSGNIVEGQTLVLDYVQDIGAAGHLLKFKSNSGILKLRNQGVYGEGSTPNVYLQTDGGLSVVLLSDIYGGKIQASENLFFFGDADLHYNIGSSAGFLDISHGTDHTVSVSAKSKVYLTSQSGINIDTFTLSESSGLWVDLKAQSAKNLVFTKNVDFKNATVRLTAEGSLFSDGSLTGGYFDLTALTGNIGSISKKVNIISDNPVNILAGGDVYLTSVAGDVGTPIEKKLYFGGAVNVAGKLFSGAELELAEGDVFAGTVELLKGLTLNNYSLVATQGELKYNNKTFLAEGGESQPRLALHPADYYGHANEFVESFGLSLQITDQDQIARIRTPNLMRASFWEVGKGLYTTTPNSILELGQNHDISIASTEQIFWNNNIVVTNGDTTLSGTGDNSASIHLRAMPDGTLGSVTAESSLNDLTLTLDGEALTLTSNIQGRVTLVGVDALIFASSHDATISTSNDLLFRGTMNGGDLFLSTAVGKDLTLSGNVLGGDGSVNFQVGGTFSGSTHKIQGSNIGLSAASILHGNFDSSGVVTIATSGGNASVSNKGSSKLTLHADQVSGVVTLVDGNNKDLELRLKKNSQFGSLTHVNNFTLATAGDQDMVVNTSGDFTDDGVFDLANILTHWDAQGKTLGLKSGGDLTGTIHPVVITVGGNQALWINKFDLNALGVIDLSTYQDLTITSLQYEGISSSVTTTGKMTFSGHTFQGAGGVTLLNRTVQSTGLDLTIVGQMGTMYSGDGVKSFWDAENGLQGNDHLAYDENTTLSGQTGQSLLWNNSTLRTTGNKLVLSKSQHDDAAMNGDSSLLAWSSAQGLEGGIELVVNEMKASGLNVRYKDGIYTDSDMTLESLGDIGSTQNPINVYSGNNTYRVSLQGTLYLSSNATMTIDSSDNLDVGSLVTTDGNITVTSLKDIQLYGNVSGAAEINLLAQGLLKMRPGSGIQASTQATLQGKRIVAGQSINTPLLILQTPSDQDIKLYGNADDFNQAASGLSNFDGMIDFNSFIIAGNNGFIGEIKVSSGRNLMLESGVHSTIKLSLLAPNGSIQRQSGVLGKIETMGDLTIEAQGDVGSDVNPLFVSASGQVTLVSSIGNAYIKVYGNTSFHTVEVQDFSVISAPDSDVTITNLSAINANLNVYGYVDMQGFDLTTLTVTAERLRLNDVGVFKADNVTFSTREGMDIKVFSGNRSTEGSVSLGILLTNLTNKTQHTIPHVSLNASGSMIFMEKLGASDALLGGRVSLQATSNIEFRAEANLANVTVVSAANLLNTTAGLLNTQNLTVQNLSGNVGSSEHPFKVSGNPVFESVDGDVFLDLNAQSLGSSESPASINTSGVLSIVHGASAYLTSTQDMHLGNFELSLLSLSTSGSILKNSGSLNVPTVSLTADTNIGSLENAIHIRALDQNVTLNNPDEAIRNVMIEDAEHLIFSLTMYNAKLTGKVTGLSNGAVQLDPSITTLSLETIDSSKDIGSEGRKLKLGGGYTADYLTLNLDANGNSVYLVSENALSIHSSNILLGSVEVQQGNLDIVATDDVGNPGSWPMFEVRVSSGNLTLNVNDQKSVNIKTLSSISLGDSHVGIMNFLAEGSDSDIHIVGNVQGKFLSIQAGRDILSGAHGVIEATGVGPDNAASLSLRAVRDIGQEDQVLRLKAEGKIDVNAGGQTYVEAVDSSIQLSGEFGLRLRQYNVLISGDNDIFFQNGVVKFDIEHSTLTLTALTKNSNIGSIGNPLSLAEQTSQSGDLSITLANLGTGVLHLVSSNPFALTTDDDLKVGKLENVRSLTAKSIQGNGIVGASSGRLTLTSTNGDIGSENTKLGVTVQDNSVDGGINIHSAGNVYLDHTGDLELWNVSLRETLDLKSSGKIDGHITIQVADDTGAYLKVDAVDNVVFGFLTDVYLLGVKAKDVQLVVTNGHIRADEDLLHINASGNVSLTANGIADNDDDYTLRVKHGENGSLTTYASDGGIYIQGDAALKLGDTQSVAGQEIYVTAPSLILSGVMQGDSITLNTPKLSSVDGFSISYLGTQKELSVISDIGFSVGSSDISPATLHTLSQEANLFMLLTNGTFSADEALSMSSNTIVRAQSVSINAAISTGSDHHLVLQALEGDISYGNNITSGGDLVLSASGNIVKTGNGSPSISGGKIALLSGGGIGASNKTLSVNAADYLVGLSGEDITQESLGIYVVSSNALHLGGDEFYSLTSDGYVQMKTAGDLDTQGETSITSMNAGEINISTTNGNIVSSGDINTKGKITLHAADSLNLEGFVGAHSLWKEKGDLEDLIDGSGNVVARRREDSSYKLEDGKSMGDIAYWDPQDISLTSGGALSGSGTVRSWKNVTLTAQNDIGSTNTPIMVYAGKDFDINAASTHGSVYLKSEKVLPVDQTKVYASNESDLSGYDSESYRETAFKIGTVTGQNISLEATGSGYHLVGNSVSATDTLTLKAADQIGESGTPLTIDYDTLTPMTVTNYVRDLGHNILQIGNLEFFGRSLEYTNDILSFTGTVNLKAMTGTAGIGLLGTPFKVASGSITFDASIIGGVYLLSSGAISLTTPNALTGDITAASLSLIAASIGTSVVPLTTHTASLTIASTGDFYVHNDQSVNLQTVSGGKGYVETTGNMTIQNDLTTGDLTLKAAGNITGQGDATISGTDTKLALQAGGNISGLKVNLDHETNGYLIASAIGAIGISSGSALILGGETLSGISGQIKGSSIDISSLVSISLGSNADNALEADNVHLTFDTFSNPHGGKIAAPIVIFTKNSDSETAMNLSSEMSALLKNAGSKITFDANGHNLNVSNQLNYAGHDVEFFGQTLNLSHSVSADNMTIGLSNGWTVSNSATVDVEKLWIYDLNAQTTIIGGSASNAFGSSVLNSLVKTPETTDVTIGFGDGKGVQVAGSFEATWRKLILQGSTVDLEARATLSGRVDVVTDHMTVGADGGISAPELHLTKQSDADLVVGTSDFTTPAELARLVQASSGIETLNLSSSRKVSLQSELDLSSASESLRVDVYGTELDGGSGSNDLIMSTSQELHLHTNKTSLKSKISKVFFEENDMHSLSLANDSTDTLKVYAPTLGTTFAASFDLSSKGDIYTSHSIKVGHTLITPNNQIRTLSGKAIYFDGIKVWGTVPSGIHNPGRAPKGGTQ